MHKKKKKHFLSDIFYRQNIVLLRTQLLLNTISKDVFISHDLGTNLTSQLKSIKPSAGKIKISPENFQFEKR
jgi:hypothetical protein